MRPTGVRIDPYATLCVLDQPHAAGLGFEPHEAPERGQSVLDLAYGAGLWA